MEEDSRKINSAVLLGWRVLTYTTDMIKSGEAIKDVLGFLFDHGGTT